MQFDAVQIFFLWAIPVIFAITLHEVSHGWVAKLCGDNTASMLGRLTLNPLKHIDLFGSVILPVLLFWVSQGHFVFGWAKPVPIDWRNLRSPRRDVAIVALAGPMANLLMALAWTLMSLLGLGIEGSSPWISAILVHMGIIGLQFNLVLMVFNLLPIPPLDGSRVITSLLPVKMAYRYNSIERFGFFIVLILLVTGILGSILLPVVSSLMLIILNIFGVSL
jgi:Zn-dependent protease